MSYDLWLFLHVLLLVFWLGTDVGVLLGGLVSKNSALSNETRATVLGVGMKLDMFPRTAMTLMLPTGMQLGLALGILRISTAAQIAVWVFALVWLAITWVRYLNESNPTGVLCAKLSIFIDAIVLVACLWIALASFGSDEGIVRTDWLATKVLLFGVIAAVVIALEFLFLPGVLAFQQIMTDGSTESREATFSKSMNVTIISVLVIYVLVLLSAWVGISKPGLF